MAYDIIGDVHGQDGKLKALLAKLGYRIKDGAYRHPDGHMALFLGDLIDRGPGQIEVVNLVRNMIEAGSGRTIMGNHEWNAIGFATVRPDGKGFLRNRSPNRFTQHEAFLRQVGLDSALHKEWVGWFKTLPPFLDLGALRLCHAWWNPEFITMIGEHSLADGALDESFMLSSFEKGSPSWVAMEGVTKGLEVILPEGSSFLDHTGVERKEIRVRWWDEAATTYRKAALVPEAHRQGIPEVSLPDHIRLGNAEGIPTFLGHYWLTGTPTIQNATTAVLDYSAAKKGPLVAYRWDGEPLLSNSAFVLAG